MAGHPRPIVLAGRRRFAVPRPAAFRSACSAGETYPTNRCVLPEDATIVLYTDGLTEARRGGRDARRARAARDDPRATSTSRLRARRVAHGRGRALRRRQLSTTTWPWWSSSCRRPRPVRWRASRAVGSAAAALQVCEEPCAVDEADEAAVLRRRRAGRRRSWPGGAGRLGRRLVGAQTVSRRSTRRHHVLHLVDAPGALVGALQVDEQISPSRCRRRPAPAGSGRSGRGSSRWPPCAG